MGVATTHEGVGGLMQLAEFADIDFVFDATSAGAHVKRRRAGGSQTEDPGDRPDPAAIGPYCVPVVNLEANLAEGNVNMVTCGGQATIPMVAAVSRVAKCTMRKSSPRLPANPPARERALTSTNSPKPPRRPPEKVGGAAKAKRLSYWDQRTAADDARYRLCPRRSGVAAEIAASIAEMAACGAGLCAGLPPETTGAV